MTNWDVVQKDPNDLKNQSLRDGLIFDIFKVLGSCMELITNNFGMYSEFMS